MRNPFDVTRGASGAVVLGRPLASPERSGGQNFFASNLS